MKHSSITHLILVALVFVVWSCSNGKSNDSETASLKLSEEYSSLPVLNLIATDTLQSFNDAYPVFMETAGDKLVVLFSMMEDTMIRVYDMATKTKLASLGLKGNGPEDVISPIFFNNRRVQADSCLSLYDSSSRETLTLSLTDYSIIKAPLNKAIRAEASVNYFDNCAISYTIMPGDYMFKIVQFEPETETHIAYPFSLSDENAEKIAKNPTFLTKIIYANESRKRIMISMSYLDAYYLYDFDGKLLKEFHLANDDFDINKAVSQLFDPGSEYLRNICSYATNRYCYLRRIYYKEDTESNRENTVVKVDWDGNPVAIIKMHDSLKSYCIDSNEDIIAIDNITHEEDTETFSIIKYKLSTE